MKYGGGIGLVESETLRETIQRLKTEKAIYRHHDSSLLRGTHHSRIAQRKGGLIRRVQPQTANI